MTNKIYSIRISVDKTDSRCNLVELNVTEKDKIYVTENNNRISKDKLMKIDTMFYENADSIRYTVYCLENDIELAKSMLLNHIQAKLETYKQSLDSTIANFESLKIQLTNG